MFFKIVYVTVFELSQQHVRYTFIIKLYYSLLKIIFITHSPTE